MTTKKQLREEIRVLRRERDKAWERCESLWGKSQALCAEKHEIKAKVAELVALTHPQQKIAILS